jgi:hypothetical protein
MLEEIKRFTYKAPDIHREVEPVRPYPRINPQQQRQEGYQQQDSERKPEDQNRRRRRFTAMRELIEQLKDQVLIKRVDFNTANQELVNLGLAIAEEELLTQLLHLKVPLASIEELIRQMRQQSVSPVMVSGRNISPEAKLFPIYIAELAEYIMRFEDLQIVMGSSRNNILDEINNNGRFVVEHNRLRLNFSRNATLPAVPGAAVNLTISIQLGAVEVDENGRRAIFYQRPDQSYALYSDKSISLSI